MAQDLIFHGQFIDKTNLDGETGLTVTIDVYRTTISDGTTSQVVTGGSCTETGGGIYRYRYASADLSLYHYVANMKTASADVAQKHVAALGLVVPDALVSSRLAPTDAGRTLDVSATGEASANVTHHAGVAVAAADANGNVPVVLYPTQGAVTFGQVKILANVAFQGALHVANSHASGIGQHNQGGTIGQYNLGGNIGQHNEGSNYGQNNYGGDAGQHNEGDIPVVGAAQQEIADALKLAPAAGTPAAGSVYDLLAGIEEDTGTTLPATRALEATAQAILEDTGTTLPALIGGLSGATVTVVSSVAGGTVTVYAADTWRFTVLSDQLALADYETLGLIVKRSARQADSQALLYLRTDTGLVRMDGAAPVSAGNGTLTKTATSFTAVVHVAETQGLVPGVYTWWLKGLDTTPAPNEAVTLATGEFVVLAAGLQAVV